MKAGAVIRKATVVLSDGPYRKSLCLEEGRVVAGPVFDGWVCDLPDHLLFPGMINAHDHLHLNAIPRLPASGPYRNSYQWIDAWRAHLDDPAVAAARAVPRRLRYWHGGLKNLLSGVTTVAHHDPYDLVFDDPAFPVRVLRRYGWAHSLRLAGAGDAAYGPGIRPSFDATPPDEPWIVHLAEGVDDVAAAELGQLDRHGCLEANTVLVHGVGLSDDDIARVVDRRASLVWCPASNLGMFGRTLDPTVLAAARRLALATDSRISGSADMLAEIQVAASHSRLPTGSMLRLVTEGPRRMLRMPDSGGLSPGDHADLLITRDPGGDPRDAVIGLRRRDIRAVVRGGMPAVADPDFAEWFDAFGIPTTRIVLDGAPKLIATPLLGPAGAAALEPNLTVEELRGV